VWGETGFFLDILVLPVALEDLRAPSACSRVPGEPLRKGLLGLRRAGFRSAAPARADVEPPALRLSRIDRPICRFSELLVPVVGLRVAFLREAEIDGVLPVIEVAMREVLPRALPTVEVRAELAAGCLTPVGVEDPRAPIEPPIRDCDVSRLDLDRLLELAAGCLASVETDGLSIRMELVASGCEPGAGLSIRIDLPIRDVLEELTRLRELVLDRLADEDTDGILVLNERALLDLAPVVGRLADEEMDGVMVVIELLIRDLLLGLIRIVELLLIEVEPVELLPMETLDEGRELEELEGLEIVIRLDIEPFALLLEEIVPERLGVDRLIDILLELLRLGTERLDVIVPDRLGIDRLIDIRPELLLRLGAERLDVIVLDRLGLLRLMVGRLGVGAWLTDDRLELLRLGVGALLGAGERLTDDLLGLLRVGAGARLGAGALAACVVWLELPELELFRELLAASTESPAKTKRKTHRINRKSQIFARRSRKIRNLELFSYVSMTASFLQ